MQSSSTGREPASAAPTAIPISAVSEIGVTRTRSRPNASTNGSVSGVAMFWPKDRTVSSRAISCLMPSSIAAMKGSSMTRSLLGVDVVEGRLGGRERALEAEGDRLLHLLANLAGDAIGVLGGQRPVGDERGAEAGHRVAGERGLVLLGRAELLPRLVLGEVQRHARRRDDVPVRAEPVHLGLDERRALARARALHRL